MLAEKTLRWTIGFTVGVWTARYLGPIQYGTLNYALSFIALFGGAASLGIDYIGVRELVRSPERKAEILGTVLGLRIASGVALGLAATGTALAFGNDCGGRALTSVLSLTLLLGCGDIFDLWFQAELRARSAATARTAVLIAIAASRVALILLQAPLAAFAWLIVAESALTSIAVIHVFRRSGGYIGGWRFSAQRARALLAESWPNIVSNIAILAYMRIDRIMLGEMKSEAAVGVYSAAGVLAEMWYVIPLTIVASATPMITRLHQEYPREYLRVVGQLARVLAAISWLLAVVLCLVAWLLVPWLYGDAYVGTGLVLGILAWGLPFGFVGVAASPWYLNERLFVVAMWRHIAGAVLNLALNFALIPRWGAAGAALATTLAFGVAHVFANAFYSRTRSLFRLQLRALLLQPPQNQP
ncbi:MAG: flippase [Opitutae bacterium]|nr:flippase [Opitutae bacterium]